MYLYLNYILIILLIIHFLFIYVSPYFVLLICWEMSYLILDLWIDVQERLVHISELGIIVYVVVRLGEDQYLDNLFENLGSCEAGRQSTP